MLTRNYFEIVVEAARTQFQPEAVTERERRLINVARDLARFLDYRTHGANDRIVLARELHSTLLAYEDVKPCERTDLEEWLKRRDNAVRADDPRR